MTSNKWCAKKSKANQKATRGLCFHTDKGVVRMDMPTGLANIARPMQKRKGKEHGSFKTEPREWRGGTLRFVGIRLDDGDLGVLLALVLLAQKHYLVKNKHLDFDIKKGCEIVGLLPTMAGDNAAAELTVFSYQTTFKALRTEAGLKSDGSKNNENIRDSLMRIRSIVAEGTMNGKGKLTNLIGAHWDGDKVFIALCYRLTDVLLGFEKSFGAVDLAEYRTLSGATTRILYFWLCCWLGYKRNGEHNTIGVETLVKHVWGDEIENVKQVVLKERRKAIMRGLKDIQLKTDMQYSLGVGVDSQVLVKIWRGERSMFL